MSCIIRPEAVAKPWKAAVFSDVQVPYHDRDAVDVAVQIMRDYAPSTLVCNGDMWDLFNLSRFPNVKTANAPK